MIDAFKFLKSGLLMLFFILVPGCSIAIKLLLRRTLVLQQDNEQ
jgi:hypothetical protein